jgi:hypothetical protein
MSDAAVAGSSEKNGLQHFEAVRKAEIAAGCPEPGKALGLAFSGGGIRSATFNLGVIQALAEKGLLKRFHYLSTISGGGYIGSWLSLFIKRYGDGDVAKAEGALARRHDKHLEHAAIRFLRAFSNYLTPRVGLSKDTLVAAATYLRNLLLNLTILIALMAALLVLPRIAAQVMDFLVNWHGFLVGYHPMMIVALILPTIIVALGLFYRPDEDRQKLIRPWFMRSRVLIAMLDVPIVTAGVLATTHFIQLAQAGRDTRFWPTIAIYIVLWIAGVAFATAYSAEARKSFTRMGITRDKVKWQAAFLVFAALAGTAGAAFMVGIGRTIMTLPEAHRFWAAVVFGPPTMIGAFLLMVTVHVGLMGRKFAEADRELWGVYGARLLALALSWMVFFLIALYATAILKWMNEWLVAMGGVAWIASTLFGVLAGKSERTGARDTKAWINILTRLAPYVFVLGLLLVLSWGLHKALIWGHGLLQPAQAVTATAAETPRAPSPGVYLRAEPGAGAAVVTVRSVEPPDLWKDFLAAAAKEYEPMKRWFERPCDWALLGIAAAGFALALLISWRVNINLFSLHHFYRNRLTRCYLGATNHARHPNPLTGFDPDDDVPLAALAKQKPLHIVGTAINLNRGRQLAWQNRRAASFAFTPHYSGYEPAARHVSGGFRPTAEYGKDAQGTAIELGAVVAISGAAASPNMGYHTSPAVAFLLTVFNVRLGHWCGDPAHPTAWKYRDPLMSLRYWIAELTGSADLDYPFVSLSDGGHFENLGIYELVRRRCAVIVASDAGADAKYAFDDLAEAMRKCYTDFGVEIEFRTKIDDIRPKREKDVPEVEWVSPRHYAVAEIKYPDGAKPGTLIYWKSSLTADLPPDIMQYRRTHKDFPHQSTADQFFDESQFESYRHLGYEAAKRSLDAMDDAGELPVELR